MIKIVLKIFNDDVCLIQIFALNACDLCGDLLYCNIYIIPYYIYMTAHARKRGSMTNEFEKYVDNDDEAVYEFCDACKELPNVKFIMAERKISELLIMIATSGKLQAIVANACDGFNFRDAFAKARVRAGKRYSLLPPSRPREMIAFAVNLLYAFDTRAVSLQDFLDEYYYSGNGISFAFTSFAHNVVVPLSDCVLGELRAFSESARQEIPPREETITEYEPLLPDEAVADLTERIADICVIAERSGAGSRELEQLYSISGGLSESVNKRDARMMRMLLVGLRGVVASSSYGGLLSEKVDELDETLRHFGV